MTGVLLFYAVLFYRLYKKYNLLPFLISYDFEGDWLYRVDGEESTTIAIGSCCITHKSTVLEVYGKREREYNKQACEILCKSFVGSPKCESCSYSKKIDQRWETRWGGITPDKKVRFDYDFTLHSGKLQGGYCVLDIDARNLNKLCFGQMWTVHTRKGTAGKTRNPPLALVPSARIERATPGLGILCSIP